MKNYIKINQNDNVAVALTTLEKGCDVDDITALDDIPSGHKIALCDIKSGEKVIKYSSVIGIASKDIKAGEHIHSHNLKTALSGKQDYTYSGEYEYKTNPTGKTFDGYLRADGRVGIRNSIFILPTVGCAGDAAVKIADAAREDLPESDIHVFTHPYGCSQLGDDAAKTAQCIAALSRHPNVGGALIVSLGCENNNLDYLAPFLGEYDKSRIKTLVLQQCGDEIKEGVCAVKDIYDVVKTDKRTPQPLTALRVGFKCGGSDGFSGITANPLCGKLSEVLANEGAGVILTEVPEMFGAEQYLFDRCKDKNVFEKAVNMINSFKDYFISHNQPVYENPSPGNKEGGITTLEEKSLGCITKGGQCAVTDVLDMYDECSSKGLSLLNGPGNDIVSVTNLACSGAVMVLFTTGRGTPLGGPVPTLKISTNNDLYKRKPHWIDYNAGVLLTDGSFHKCRDELEQLVIETACGKKTANEINGCEQIAVFKDGVTL